MCAFLGAQTFVLYSLHVFLFVREVFFCIFLQFIQDLYDAVIAGEAVKVLDQLACLVNDAEKLFVLGVDKLDACQILVCKLAGILAHHPLLERRQLADQDIAAENVAVQPFREEFHKLGEHPLLFRLVINVDEFIFPYLIAEKCVLGALANQFRITDLHHVFLLVGKMCLRVIVKLFKHIFQFLIVVAVIVGTRQIVRF